MPYVPTALPGVLLFDATIYRDNRGFFFESFNRRHFDEAVGHGVDFVQDNHSRSSQGVLRGLHYQLPPHAQGKLVRVTSGEIFDVAVDLRKGSATYGRWVGERLSETNKRQLWIPPGFAHGFVALSAFADVLYKTTDFYHPRVERCIKWNDPDIGIDWPFPRAPRLSEKDANGTALIDAEVFD
jgi:dTDP-4-dehydrorhamnose 3,5-epimerase